MLQYEGIKSVAKKATGELFYIAQFRQRNNMGSQFGERIVSQELAQKFMKLQEGTQIEIIPSEYIRDGKLQFGMRDFRVIKLAAEAKAA